MLQGKFGPYVNENNVWEIWAEMYNTQEEDENKEKNKEEDNGNN